METGIKSSNRRKTLIREKIGLTAQATDDEVIESLLLKIDRLKDRVNDLDSRLMSVEGRTMLIGDRRY